MYHVESSPNVKLSYLPSPGLLNIFLLKYDIEISPIPKPLGKKIQIQMCYIFITNSGIVLSKDVKVSKSGYFKNYFLLNKNNMKKICSKIRSVIDISKVKADYIPSILESGQTFDNPCAIANIFNNFFVNAGKNTDKDIPRGNCCPTSFLKGNFLIQCFSPLLLQLKLIYTYFKWTITNPLVPIVFQSHCKRNS